jgi:hypothetical protein
MKKIYLLASFLATVFMGHAQNVANDNGQNNAPEILRLKETEFDFGKIPQGKPVYHYFDVTNLGSTPLKLDNVQASCGCTTPVWEREAISPGGTAQIKVGFNAAGEGPFQKTITVLYNGNQTKIITIKGTVWRAPAGSAPVNASIQILKQQNL